MAYGNKTLPSVFKLASQDSARTRSLVATYFIVSGSLSREVLAEEFSALGYRSVSEPGFSVMDQLMMVAVKSSSLVAIAIALLSFLSLTLIYRVKDLRFVGIRLISGESLPSVMFRSFKQDSLELGLATLLAFGLALYALMQLSFSFVLSLIYLVAVRQEGLVALLKGKLPLKRLMGLMLCGQFLAVLVIGFSGGEVKKAYEVIREKESAQTAWENRQDFGEVDRFLGFCFQKRRGVSL